MNYKYLKKAPSWTIHLDLAFGQENKFIYDYMKKRLNGYFDEGNDWAKADKSTELLKKPDSGRDG